MFAGRRGTLNALKHEMYGVNRANSLSSRPSWGRWRPDSSADKVTARSVIRLAAPATRGTEPLSGRAVEHELHTLPAMEPRAPADISARTSRRRHGPPAGRLDAPLHAAAPPASPAGVPRGHWAVIDVMCLAVGRRPARLAVRRCCGARGSHGCTSLQPDRRRHHTALQRMPATSDTWLHRKHQRTPSYIYATKTPH